MQRKCGRCGGTKPVSEFAGGRKEGEKLDSYCRPCRAAYGREHYAANRQRYIEQALRRKDELRAINYEFLVEFLRAHPCVDCGETDVLVLEFDHVTEKSFPIAQAMRDRFWEAISEEIAKCDVVCANCHRRRTARRGGFVRFVVTQQLGPAAA